MTNEQREKITVLRNQGFGYTAIANSVGLSKDSVKAYCRTHGLAGEKAESHSLAEVPTQLCLNCGKTLIQLPGRKQKKFCCSECRTAWWNAHPETVKQKAVYTFTCPECGKEFTAYGNAKRKYCSHDCYIAARFKEYCEDPITKHRRKNYGELPQYFVEDTHDAVQQDHRAI